MRNIRRGVFLSFERVRTCASPHSRVSGSGRKRKCDTVLSASLEASDSRTQRRFAPRHGSCAVYSTEGAHGGARVGQKSVLDAVTNRQCGAMARASCRPNRSPPSPCEPLEGAIAPAPSDFYAAVILGAFHGQTGGNGDGGGHPQRVWRRWRRWRWRAGVATRRDTCACSGSDGTRADGGARARPHTCAFARPHAQPDISADTCAHARAVTCAFARPHAEPDTCADTCTHARADAGPRPRRGAVRQCRDLGRLDHGADFAQRAGPDAGTHGLRRERHR
jgi:hypothetical protein